MEAIATTPDNNVGAINLYSDYLAGKGDPAGALDAIERYARPEQLQHFPGLDTRRVNLRRTLNIDSGEAEVDEKTAYNRLTTNPVGLAVLSPSDAAQLKKAIAEFRSSRGASADLDHANGFSHTVNQDDCRGSSYNIYYACAVASNGYYYCYYPFAINLAEIMYNEDGGRPWGEVGMVGWTIRDRVYEEPATETRGINGIKWTNCNAYPGSFGSSLGTSLQCGQSDFCPDSANYCRAEHGGTTNVGDTQFQFNDTHQDFSTVLDPYQYDVFALDILADVATEIYDQYTPPGASGCSFSCSNPFCTSSSNPYLGGGSPYGPLEYRSSQYQSQTSCVHAIGTVCSGGNYYYGRGTGQTQIAY